MNPPVSANSEPLTRSRSAPHPDTSFLAILASSDLQLQDRKTRTYVSEFRPGIVSPSIFTREVATVELSDNFSEWLLGSIGPEFESFMTILADRPDLAQVISDKIGFRVPIVVELSAAIEIAAQ